MSYLTGLYVTLFCIIYYTTDMSMCLMYILLSNHMETCFVYCLQVDDLNTMYNEIYDKCGDIDERDFFDASGYLWIPFGKEER